MCVCVDNTTNKQPLVGSLSHWLLATLHATGTRVLASTVRGALCHARSKESYTLSHSPSTWLVGWLVVGLLVRARAECGLVGFATFTVTIMF